tara:strand:- start:7119 stop:7451 length:333 start_codon:yes stop_codon:yes gene_type:complete
LGYGAGKLLLTCSAKPNHSLLYTEGGIFENGNPSNRHRGDDGTSGGTQNLGGLKILDVNSLLDRNVPRFPFLDIAHHGLVNFSQTHVERQFGLEFYSETRFQGRLAGRKL